MVRKGKETSDDLVGASYSFGQACIKNGKVHLDGTRLFRSMRHLSCEKRKPLTLIKQATSIGTAPLLLCYQDAIPTCVERGTILFYPGFGGSKEQPEQQLKSLADAGFLVVSVDNVGHGERRYTNFTQLFNDERWATAPDATEADFLQIIRETAHEASTIIDELLRLRWARLEHLGIAGISMGGEIAYAVCANDPRVRAATPIVGSPEWTLPWPDSPHRHTDRFFPIALLSQVAANDEAVPARHARSFHERLTPHYAKAPERLGYIEFPDVGHRLSPALWEVSCQNMVAWFQRFL